MKRIIMILFAVILCLSLTACSKAPESEQGLQETHTETMNTEIAVSTEVIQQSIELVGPWHLDSEKNNLAAFADSLDLFPGYGEWGASMEIRSNGQMSWYIGAEGWYGTYAVESGTIHAQLTSNLDQSTQPWVFRITEENGTAVLEMDYQDMAIYWVYGDRGDIPAMGNDENQDVAAYPGADVVEIVNLRGDTTTIYKLADGTYMDRMERRFTYDGAYTWTDENGVEWNEVA